MAERKIHEMSYEELKLYKEQLTRKLTSVNFYLRQHIGSKYPKVSYPQKDNE